MQILQFRCKIILVTFKFVYDANILQTGFYKFYKLSEQNFLSLNIIKCQVITFTSSKNTIIFYYQINNYFLNRVNSINDLEVYYENDLLFKLNHRMLGFINKNTRVYLFKNIICH